MHKEIISSIAIAILFSTGASAAHVEVLDVPYIALEAPAEVYVGDSFSVSIFGDFYGLGFFAGGLQLGVDNRLHIDYVELHLDVDPNFSCPGAAGCPDDAPGTVSLIWALLQDDLIAPDSGPTLMATISVTAISCCGDQNLVLFDSLVDFTGGWFGAGFVEMDAPELVGTTVRVNPIPLPAALWLMVAAIGVLAGLSRRNAVGLIARIGENFARFQRRSITRSRPHACQSVRHLPACYWPQR